VIRALEGHDLPAVRAALRQALVDHHPLVQQAAEKALFSITRGKTEPVSNSLTSTAVMPSIRRSGPPPLTPVEAPGQHHADSSAKR
jgi:hypothetical protein